MVCVINCAKNAAFYRMVFTRIFHWLKGLIAMANLQLELVTKPYQETPYISSWLVQSWKTCFVEI